MAELGLAIVSLGLQVCDGIHTYVDGLRSRDAEVEAVRKLADDLAAILASTKSLLRSDSSSTLLSGPGAIHSLHLCDERIKALDKLGRDLAGQELSSIPGIRQKAKEAVKRLEYPFKRDNLIKLRQELRQSWEVVQAAIQSLNLNINIATNNTAGNVDSTLSTLVSHTIPRIESQGQALLSHANAMSVTSRDAHETTQNMVKAMNARLDAIAADIKNEDRMALFLLARPDLIQNLCNQALPQDHPKRAHTQPKEAEFASSTMRNPYKAPVTTCTCAALASQSHGAYRWGPFYFFNRTQVTEHLDSCPVSNLLIPSSNTTRQYTALMAGVPARLLRRALEIRVSTAGSTNLCAQIRSYNIVDACKSPSFGIMRCLITAFDEFGNGYGARDTGTRHHWQNWRDDTNVKAFRNSVFPHAMKLITRCFKEGLASARDVDESNNNLFHELARLGVQIDGVFDTRSNEVLIKAYEDMSNMLTILRVEADLCNSEGSQPVRLLAEANWSGATPIDMITPLLPRTEDDITGGPLPRLYGRCHAGSVWRQFESFLEAPHLTHLFLDELSTAVLQRGYAFVEKKVRQDPSLALGISETTSTVPILLAFYDPRMLALLASHIKISQLRSQYIMGATLIGLALSYSSWVEDKEGCTAEPMATSCSCTAPLETLLSRGCSVSPSVDFWDLVSSEHGLCRYENIFKDASSHAKLVIATALKRQTLQLYSLAETELTPVDWEALKLGTEVCDSKVGQVYSKLRQRKVDIPSHLRLGDLSILGLECHIEQMYSKSIFYELSNVEDASLFESLGFYLTGPDEPHRPVEDCLQYYGFKQIDVDFVDWILERGGQLVKLEPPRPCDVTSNDVILGNWAGRWLRYERFVPAEHYDEASYGGAEPEELSAFERFHDNIVHQKETDCCVCFCSPEGCNSFVRMIKVLAHQRTDIGNRWLDDLPHYLEWWGSKLHKQHHRTILRLFTFEALDIRHTCRDMPDDGQYFREVFNMLDDEEIQELHEEDELAIHQLEKLMVEFEDLDWMKGAQDNEVVPTEDVLHFWKRCWRERIRQARNEMRETGRADTKSPNAMGVEVNVDWDKESVSSGDSSLLSYMPRAKSPCACDACEAGMGDRFAEFWIQEMDKLVP